MQGETRERWQKLCEQAAVEQNPEKLMELIRQIIGLLDEKHKRVKHQADLPENKAHEQGAATL